MRSTNTSGVTGLGIVMRPSGPFVRASWCVGRNIGRTEFSVRRHGRLGATELAMLAREEGSGTAIGRKPAWVWKQISAGLEL